MDLSIIIPTFNRCSSLRKTLMSIVEQHPVQFAYEVIVVDNGSSDATRQVCEEMGKQIPHFTRYYDAEPGLLTGRHKGAEISSGAILSFIDDDVELNPGWLQAVYSEFCSNPDAKIIGGPSLPRYQAYPPDWIKFFWQPAPYGKMCLPLSLLDFGADKLEIDPLYVFGLNYSIRKQILLELDGFHPDCIPKHLQKYQGDGETGLSIKAKSRKLKAYYLPSALLYHQVSMERLTPAYFENWFYYNGVCSSFTEIRVQHKLYPDSAPGHPAFQHLFTRIWKKTVRIIGSLKKKPVVPEEIIRLQESFSRKFSEGYNFHQEAFASDQNVREWVLKQDFWNYRLPAS